LALLENRALASPNHDEVQARTPLQTSRQRYLSGRRLGGQRQPLETCEQVHTKPMEPMRIGYEMIDAEDVDPKLRAHVERNILTKAIAFWSQALKVHPVAEPLRAERAGRDCMKFGLGWQKWVVAEEGGFSCSSASRPRCGEGPRIPDRFLKATRVCSRKCPQMLETLVHVIGHLEGVCDNCTTLPEGPGAVGYDFMALVTIKNSSFCGGLTQAHASSCVKDQCDRPIFGWVNFCPGVISLDPRDNSRQVSTAIHELAHALAFSSQLFGHFRKPDGTPRLPRDPNDPTKLRDSVRWSCSGTSYTWNDPKGDRHYVDLSSAGIIEKFNERGLDSCPCPVGLRNMFPGCIQPPPPAFREPKCVFKLVTPKVKEKAREYFGCDWLPGAEIENQPTSSCVIVGSHWEERIFMGELMTAGQFGDYIFLSAVTLALFEDSGWYLPDYSMADPLVKGVHWGYGLGCSFATEKCVTDGQTEFPRFWCQKKDAMKCSLSRKQQVQCTLIRAPVELKPAFTFFDEAVIGDTAEADFCPYFHTPISNHVCTDPHASTFPISNANFMREVFGDDSRCLESTLHADVQADNGVYKADKKYFAESQPGCFKVSCAAGGASYDVLVSDLQGSTVSLGTCTGEGQALSVSWLRGELTCAAPMELCSEGLGTPRHTLFGRANESAGPILADALPAEPEEPQSLLRTGWLAYAGCITVGGTVLSLLVFRLGRTRQVRTAGFELITH